MADVGRELRGREFWLLSALVFALLVPFLLAPEVVPFAFGAVPVLLSCLAGRVLLTAMVGAVAVVVSAAVLMSGNYEDVSPGRRMLIVLVAVAISLVLAWVVQRWKSRVKEQAEQYRLLAENVMDTVLAVDLDLTVTWASPSVEQFLGYRPSEVVGRNVRELILEEDVERLRGGTTTVLSGVRHVTDARFRTSTGQTTWAEITPRLVHDDAGHVTGIVLAIRDIEERIAVGQALQREMEFDGLTGLAKRALGLERIDEVLARAEPGTWVLASVGVQGMTRINHAYSHQAGDRVLQWVAERLVEAAGSPDRVCRVAGDEFAVILHDVDGPEAAAGAARDLLAALSGTLDFAGHAIEVSAAVGLALPHGTGAADLLGDATEARRRAAGSGSERWGLAEGDAGDRAREALALLTSLRTALDSGGLRPWFMPVVSLTGRRLAGYECLVRWEREDGSVVGPDGFLPLAEQSGLIRDIDRSVFAHVVSRAARTSADVEFGVNISAATLGTDDFCDWMMEAIHVGGVRPDRLMLEVTETSLMHVSGETIAAMERLAGHGASWWVDDFGTGFSSISHLRDLPIAGLKLDRSFTADVTSAPRSAQLAGGLAGLATGMGLWTVAEGIETREQAAALRDLGWGFGQGWYFGRPDPDLRPSGPLEDGTWP